MTSFARRKQNRLNAQKSTGPKTEEGKAASRQNALKHGLTAATLTLPNEDPTEMKLQIEALHEALDPQSHDEDIVVDQLAIMALRLNRFAKAETAMLAEQVRNAEIQWDFEQKIRVLDLSRSLEDDPTRTVLELKTFAAGAEWLLLKMKEQARDRDPQETLRLLGIDPTIATEMPSITRVDKEIAYLTTLVELLKPLSEASREGAKTRAGVLIDSPENRLFMRYLKTTGHGFESAFKMLTKLQAEREKLATDEVKEADPRNEAALRGRGYARRIYPGSYVIVNGIMYTAADVSDGNLCLVPVSPIFDPIRTGETLEFENAV